LEIHCNGPCVLESFTDPALWVCAIVQGFGDWLRDEWKDFQTPKEEVRPCSCMRSTLCAVCPTTVRPARVVDVADR